MLLKFLLSYVGWMDEVRSEKRSIKTMIWGLLLKYIYIRKNLPLGSKATSLLKIIKYSYKVHFFKILNLSEGKFDLLIAPHT